ncbi:hypothetical protein R1sor_024859 [Riccia sorocarpa]|uniref:Uncharacterized protein n=1 Tax=Riccia sorocarpa TaxID=122646 RepID=A0ABD3GRQ0_9MARC
MGSISGALESGGFPEKTQKSHNSISDEKFRGYVLGGFVEAVLFQWGPDDDKENANVSFKQGQNCQLHTEGNETCVLVEGLDKTVLVQVKKTFSDGEQKQLADNPHSEDTSELHQNPDFPRTSQSEHNIGNPGYGDTGQCLKRRVSGYRVPNQRCYNSGILDQLHDLVKKNNVKVDGKVVDVQYLECYWNVVVLFDVYFPDKLFNFGVYPAWRGGPFVGAALSHLSSDWMRRRQILDDQLSYSHESLANTGACRVLGCSNHLALSEAEKNVRFDLNSMFGSLNCIKHDAQEVTSLKPAARTGAWQSGIWQLPDEILTSILNKLAPTDLLRVSAVARHFQQLAASIMPCINLKLYPHQEAAVGWMMYRERPPRSFPYPHSGNLVSEDGLGFYFDKLNGDLLPGGPPWLHDFRGGLVCDEPGLGKTVTALSLILKTQGVLASPPPDVDVQWCEHSSAKKAGYYEVSTSSLTSGGMSAVKRCSVLKAKRYQMDPMIKPPSSFSFTPPSSSSSSASPSQMESQSAPPLWRSPRRGGQSLSCRGSSISPVTDLRASGRSDSLRSSGRAKRKLWESSSVKGSTKKARRNSGTGGKKRGESDHTLDEDDTWAQCDACGKWRKIPKEGQPVKEGLAWFCSMNKDEDFQDCSVPEEIFDKNEMIKSLPGFVHAGNEADLEVNVPFFKSVLRAHAHFIDEEAKRALKWLIQLPPEKVLKATVEGLQLPQTLQMASLAGNDVHRYEKIFEAFGLVKRKEPKKSVKWFYPKNLDNLVFDSSALREALAEPVDEVMRFYLSKATLVVVPNNLIEHWRTQILKHTSVGQLKCYFWNDVKKLPAAHVLAWEYDVVITTFSRLSAEWTSRDTSALAKIHWLRIILDEGHTLGAGVAMTNKLQMAVSIRACRRWILTGTPTPNTPSTQVAHLQPMLKFLHEEIYGDNPKVFDTAILRPFEAGVEEGRHTLLHLLKRCMISARKCDLDTIPPCIRSVKLLDFTSEEHARSYNELVVTVRRNILMADWKDPDHVESLLNPKQWKFRNSTLRNVRLSCCVAGHIKVSNAKGDLTETLDMLASEGMDPTSEDFETIRRSLLVGGACVRCSDYCRLPVVTPCRHLLCLACVSLDCTKCTKCGHPYQMQSPEDRARPENPNPKWPVPQDLIELQPSYVQKNWCQNWHSQCSSKIAYLLRQLHDMNSRNVITFSQFRDRLQDLDSRVRLGEESQHPGCQPEKAIVFSQFLEHISAIEKQCEGAGIKSVGMYSPMQIKEKMKSLIKFKSDPECTVLVMDGSGALGLDLSFVTNVYLMEPIWDRSMEEQVVSRAHRMGATRPILVETLAMRGTIEEQMIEFLKVARRSRGAAKDPAETYLEELDFVHWKG